jgi:hypothetical protein
LQVDCVLRRRGTAGRYAEHTVIDREAQSLVLQQLVGDELSPVAFEETTSSSCARWSSEAVESQA